jgi:hypothetical protein
MPAWQESKAWADQFIPHIKALLAQYFIAEATPQQDARENTDLLFAVEGKRFGVRIRNLRERGGHPSRRHEWTVRLGRPSGWPSEFYKILRGLGDYYLYGWGDDTGPVPQVKAYTIFDLREVAAWFAEYGFAHGGQYPGRLQINADKSSTFLGVPINSMPDAAIMVRDSWLEGDPVAERMFIKIPGQPRPQDAA